MKGGYKILHVPKYFMEDLFMNEFENTKVTENEDAQDWNPDLMDEEEHTTDTFDDVVEKTEEKSNEDSTFAAESDNADESAETTPNDDTSDREIQCAACGNISKQRNWFLSRIGTHYVICPKCGTLRYVCHNNAGYRKE